MYTLLVGIPPPFDIYSAGSRLSADTVAKMVEILQQVQPDRDMELWYWVGLRILDISVDKMKKITSTCTTDVQRLQVMVTFWLINCPYASWRLLIWSLEVADRSEIANTIHGLAEPLKGTMLCSNNVHMSYQYI